MPAQVEKNNKPQFIPTIYKIDKALTVDPYYDKYEIEIEHDEIYVHKQGRQMIKEVKIKSVSNQFDTYDS